MAAEKGGSSGGGGVGFPLGVLAILLVVALARGGGFSSGMFGGGAKPGSGTDPISGSIALDDVLEDTSIISSPNSVSTTEEPAGGSGDVSGTDSWGGGTSNSSGYGEPTPSPIVAPKGQTTRLSNEKIESKLASLYRSLDKLSAEVRELTLRSPISPYAETVTLGVGTARNKDPLYEYVSITANSKNSKAINISNWYLQSYVTEETDAIPRGDRVVEKWRSPVLSDILLEPGEQARIFTTESPIDASFRENMCTGYLSAEKTFYPSLSHSCPRPLDDMEKFGDIDLDDDSCYDFVERLRQCTPLDEDAVDDADLSGDCNRFLDKAIGHNECVTLHRYDPFFDNPGGWRVYLDQDDDLWRAEREIIRLMDENDLVIDYVEY